MHNFFGKLVRTGLVCGILMTAVPMTSMAAIGPGFKTGTYIATITAESVNINKTKDGEDVLTTAKAGSVFEVLEDLGNGWMKIRVNDTEGYLPVSGNAEVEEAEAGEIEQVQKEAIESSNSYKRQQLVSYALQFVGGPYRYGGSDPHTGTDCSGFTLLCVSAWFRYFFKPFFRQPGFPGNCNQRVPDAAGRSAFLRKWKEYQSCSNVHRRWKDRTCFYRSNRH